MTHQSNSLACTAMNRSASLTCRRPRKEWMETPRSSSRREATGSLICNWQERAWLPRKRCRLRSSSSTLRRSARLGADTSHWESSERAQASPTRSTSPQKLSLHRFGRPSRRRKRAGTRFCTPTAYGAPCHTTRRGRSQTIANSSVDSRSRAGSREPLPSSTRPLQTTRRWRGLRWPASSLSWARSAS